MDLHGIIDIPKNDAVLMLEGGYLLMQMGRYKEAQDIFTGVSALLPHSDIPQVALGNLFFIQKKFDQALKEHQKALKRVPSSALAYAHIGEVLLFQKKRDEGVAALEKSIELESSGPTAQFARELMLAKDVNL